MPSDARTLRALDALAAHRDRFRSAASAAHDQMAAYLAAHRARTHGHAQSAARELGRFASGRIDVERFGALFANAHVLTTETTERIERLVGVIAEVLAEGDELFIADVPPGGDLRHVVDDTLAHAGRVFGAVLAFQAVKTGMYHPDRHDGAVASFPFAKWNRNERLLGLPLIVEVDGADLRAEELASYLDGRMSIVLVARGTSTPAPLARLLTPGMFVMQTADVAGLKALATHDGPAIAALVSSEAAQFRHDPRGGPLLRDRLTVAAAPAIAPKQPLGGRSVWQQLEELALLEELDLLGHASATIPAVVTPAVAAPMPAAPVRQFDEAAVDGLATWLLTESGLVAENGTPNGALAP